ncbi:dodecin [Nakamurella leprariae]|uniref:Dodecin domain-containing protein n=1 Tax=Nakamurella leprariae TaxID=2803911 RepID=A0A938Y989_9ACTN|nr:dodecin [Nakamurella leprariae]MBM9468391.1 dodecin domain-containing protein [Nakamurella leprariae]
MTEHVYRVTEIVGTSKTGVEDAITNAVQRAARTLRHLDWFETSSIRGEIENGQVAHYQVTMKVGFRLEDSDME